MRRAEAFTDLDRFLSYGLDAVIVASTLSLHAEQAISDMLAENYRFIDDIELVNRMADDGRFGRMSFGEGEYLHDCRDLALNSDGTPTWAWRARKGRGRPVLHPQPHTASVH